MIGLIQRVQHAKVEVDQQCVGQIGKGLLILLGVEQGDSEDSAKKLADKLLKLRIFNDQQGKMNLNVAQAEGELLVVSQFTLAADTSKGNRPGFSRAAPAKLSEALYRFFIDYCRSNQMPVASGQFGADMQVSLCNDGPVTFHLQVD